MLLSRARQKLIGEHVLYTRKAMHYVRVLNEKGKYWEAAVRLRKMAPGSTRIRLGTEHLDVSVYDQ